MRKPLLVLVAILLFLAAIEASSSYVLFRHFARSGKPFQPSGHFASADLVRRTFKKHDVTVTADPEYVFVVDPKLGYVLRPGSYQLTEHNVDSVHDFHLTVDATGHRISSFAPVQSSRRILLAGDSGTFGWGVNDEATITWLLQSRLPEYQVINLSMTSYSTIHALLQLQDMRPEVGPEDIVILVYHPITNDFNSAAQVVLKPMVEGFEMQLGNGQTNATFPFGSIDEQGKLKVERVPLVCGKVKPPADCHHPEMTAEYKYRVTELAMDTIAANIKGKLVFAILNGEGDDAVIQHARASGMTIVDFRGVHSDAVNDFSAIDGHAGPFWHHMAFVQLYDALRSKHLLNSVQ